MRDEYGLNPRQRAFADYYLQTGNAREAARKAGYKNDAVMATQNIALPCVKQYIDARLKAQTTTRIADVNEVLLYLSGVIRGEIKDQFGLDASLQERTRAAQELLKRYAVADTRQASTMARLDSLLIEFKTALSNDDSSGADAAGAGADAETQVKDVAAVPAADTTDNTAPDADNADMSAVDAQNRIDAGGDGEKR